MKIQCDVCSREEATVFCTADEAALCDACDHRVHHANKLASKHQRFSLLHPSAKQVPLCDVCQEKRAFLFCQQDRAILCRDCDLPIHTANEHTHKHNRFLLTGIKLSPTSALYSPASSAADSASDGKSQPSIKKAPESVLPMISHPPSTTNSSSPTTTISKVGDASLTSEGGSTSSISEYLIEMLPGWHVEDLLDPTSAPSGFCKSSGDGDGLPYFLDADLDNSLSSFSSQNLGIWVPQAPISLHPSQYSSFVGGEIGLKEFKEAATTMNANSKEWGEDVFTVPQISPPSIGSKRSRSFR